MLFIKNNKLWRLDIALSQCGREPGLRTQFPLQFTDTDGFEWWWFRAIYHFHYEQWKADTSIFPGNWHWFLGIQRSLLTTNHLLRWRIIAIASNGIPGKHVLIIPEYVFNSYRQQVDGFCYWLPAFKKLFANIVGRGRFSIGW